MAILPQVFSMNVLTSQLNILQYINEMHPSTCCPAAKHPKHNMFQVTNIRRKPVDFFYGTKREFTLALAIIYQT